MPTINFDASAELYVRKDPRFRNAPLTYKRFDKAAEAVRYALEVVPPEQLASTLMEVDDERFDGKSLRSLYDSEDYPLPRRSAR